MGHDVMQMKQKLRQIFYDVSNGKLSQKEALEKLEAIRLQERGKRIGALLVTPVWQGSGEEACAEASRVEYTEHQVILCELSQVNVGELGSLLPHSQCVLLDAGEDKSIAQRYSEYALACFEGIKRILGGKPAGKVLMQIVIGGDQEHAVFAGLSGLLKTAALENPQLLGQLIFATPQTTTEELGRQLQAEKAGGGRDTLIRYERGARQVLGWQEVPADPEKPQAGFKAQGVYLITGGLGALGVLFAREILEQARESRIVLSGRSALGSEKQVLLDGLCAQAGRLSYRQGDLGDLAQVRQLIAGIQDEYGQLNGILHSAGMIAGNFILKKASAEISEVLAPKVPGTYKLDQATQDAELEFFMPA